jgi:hypothetical protein
VSVRRTRRAAELGGPLNDLDVSNGVIEEYYAKCRLAGMTDEQIDQDFIDRMVASYEEILRANDLASFRKFESETIHFLGRYQTQFKETAGDPRAWEGPERVKELRRDLETIARNARRNRDRAGGSGGDAERLLKIYRMYAYYASGKSDLTQMWVMEAIGNVSLGAAMAARPRLISTRPPGPIGRGGNPPAEPPRAAITRWTVKKGEGGPPPTVREIAGARVRPMDKARFPEHRETFDGKVPGLKGDFEVLEPPTSSYNCFGYSKGLRNHAQPPIRWGKPEEVGVVIERFYADSEGGAYKLMPRMDFSFEAGKQKVAVYGARMPNGDVIPYHAAVQAADGTWHSKMGENSLIRHRNPQALVGASDAPELLFGLERNGVFMP